MEMNDREWAARQTQYLNPPAGWEADAAAALRRLRARRPTPRSPFFGWKWPAWTFAASLALICLWPLGRTAAQQLWQLLTVEKVAFVRVNEWPAGVPSPLIKVLGGPVTPQRARDLDEARSRVHYDPRLPHAGILSGAPKLATTPSLAAGTIIHVGDLEQAMNRAGIVGKIVPPQWEGARVALKTSPTVIAEWPEIALVQSKPLTLVAPPDFDFAAFSELVMRIVGVGPEDAARLAQTAGTMLPWLAPISRNLRPGATIEEIALNGGRATLVEERLGPGEPSSLTLVWTVADRVYLLHGTLERQLAIAVANAVQ